MANKPILEKPFVWISPLGFVYSYEDVYHNQITALQDYLAWRNKPRLISKLYWYGSINWN